MAISEVSIANMALAKIGEELITSLDDNVKQAQYIKTIFPQVRRNFLTYYDWHFNRKIATLSYTTTTPEDYTYEYILPTDFLKLLTINESTTEDFEIRGDKLYSDNDEIEIKYLADIEDFTFMPPMMAEALACLLASELAVVLTGDKQIKLNFYQEFQIKAREAYWLDMEQYKEDEFNIDEDEWVSAGRG